MVLIICPNGIELAPYVLAYEKILISMNAEYIVLSWEKSSSMKKDEKHFVFAPGIKELKKIRDRLYINHLWRKYIKKLIKEYKCDRLIVTPTISGIKVADLLLWKYRNRYIYDIRDFTREQNKIFKFIEDRLIKNSFATFISSRGFLNWLCISDRIHLIHNIHPFLNENLDTHSLNKNKITIGYVGLLQYEVQNRLMVNALNNNERFTLLFKGQTISEFDLQKHCEENGINNAKFTGKFKNEDKQSQYSDIDMINSLYYSSKPELRSQLPNRLYDCAILKKPILVCSNTYVSEIVNKFKLGLSLDLDNDDILMKIDDYIKEFNEEKFVTYCSKFLDMVNKEQVDAYGIIENFIKFAK